MIPKIYLSVVGLLYLALAIWCTIQPAITSAKVGFELKGGTGQSEFMTVYGGLEFGLALVLIASMFREQTLTFGVVSCVIIHASLVAFRTIAFFRFSDFDRFTYNLAVGEWIIMLIGIAILYFNARGSE